MDCFIGIDPGGDGACCALLPELKKLAFIDNKTRSLDILKWIQQIHSETIIVKTVIEDVHSLGGMSAKSNFGFGYKLAQITTIFNISETILTEITPKVWQAEVGVFVDKKIKGEERSNALKQNVAELCMKHYPGCNIFGPRGGLKDGRSDALMIAHYAYITYNS